MTNIDIIQGSSPLVLGLPHTGTKLPDDCAQRLNARGLAMSDTDWHIHDLYADLLENVTMIRTRVHRYVIDVNRDPSGKSLYPGQNTTGLCPLTDFDGQSIYQSDQEPNSAEVARRLELYHLPYHAALKAELDRIRRMHGFAILYDCHSIRSRIPFLFDGVLPDFNIGTDEGRTCDADIARAVSVLCAQAKGYTSTVNGRFKGGWTTRHYGRPTEGVHAIQMELAQSIYMVEHPPWTYKPVLADQLRNHLKSILQTLNDWRPNVPSPQEQP